MLCDVNGNKAKQSITNTQTRTNFPNCTRPTCGFVLLVPVAFPSVSNGGYKCDLAV